MGFMGGMFTILELKGRFLFWGCPHDILVGGLEHFLFSIIYGSRPKTHARFLVSE
jgi:hypothetical protein